MQLPASIAKALVDQVQKEFSAAYLYLAMAAWFEERNYDGFGKWMRQQSKEEMAHGMKFFDYLLDRGASATLHAIPAPAAKWKAPLDVFEAARKHEETVSASINAMYARAGAEKDWATQAMLQWFLIEQVEEEKTSTAIVERLRIVGDSTAGLLMLDRQLGERGGE